jgi:ubiquinone/menaquinone biosynthesis C-methylase UbiE
MEAMVMGKPVVASRVGGTPEVVKDSETGMLIPARDSRGIAEAVTELLKDKERASEMGRAGSERIKTYFTPEAAVGRLEKLYEKFIVRRILSREGPLSEDKEGLRRFEIKQFYNSGEEQFNFSPTQDYVQGVRRKALLELLKPLAGERVLEVGCGRCRDITFFSSGGAKLVGMDFSEMSVVEGKRNIKDTDKDILLTVGDATRLPFKEGVFDKVYCKEVMEHIPDYEAAIQEIARVLKVGGIAAITCPNWLSMRGLGRAFATLKEWTINRGGNHPYDNWKTQRVMERSLKKHGFEIKDRLGIDFLPGSGCSKWSNESQATLIKLIGFIESKFLWRLTAFGNAIGLSAVKKSDSR